MSYSLQDAWIDHLRPSLNPVLFPRDFGLGRYPKVSCRQEYLLRTKLGQQSNSYVAVYSTPQIEAEVMDTLFTDIDAPVEYFPKLWDTIKQIHILHPIRCYFSGNKGFHIYFDFPLIQRKMLRKKAILDYLYGLGLEYIDEGKMFDMRAMARIPYTLNEGSGRYCIPVTGDLWNASLEQLLKASKPYNVNPINVDIADIAIKDMTFNSSFMPEDKDDEPKDVEEVRVIGWIEDLFTRPVTSARHRLIWLVLAPYLVNYRKLPISEAKEILLEYMIVCNEAEPLNKDSHNLDALVDYFISYASSSGVYPASLKKLQSDYPEVYEAIK